jgi:hypothetical protein
MSENDSGRGACPERKKKEKRHFGFKACSYPCYIPLVNWTIICFASMLKI